MTADVASPSRLLIRIIRKSIHFVANSFTPCQPASWLLEAVAEAARSAASGDVALLSPACSGLDQHRNHQHRGRVLYGPLKSIGRGGLRLTPHIHGCYWPGPGRASRPCVTLNYLLRFFLRKNPKQKTQNNQTSIQMTP